MGVDGVDSGRTQQCLAVDVEQQVNCFGAVFVVTALDEHAGGAELLQGQRLTSHVGQGAGGSGVEQGRRFREVRRDQGGEGHQVTHRLDGIVVEEAVTAGGDHDRVEDDKVVGVVAKEVPDGADDGGVGEHADLDCVEADIGDQGLELLGDELRWYHVHSGHALGVLCGEGRDHGRAVDAQRREGLEVGLDAGTAGGVAAGDGQPDRWAAHLDAPSQAARSARVAAATSGWPQMALTTAAPTAPALRTWGTRSTLMPPMATQGQGLAEVTWRSVSRPPGAAASSLVAVPQTGPTPR